MPKTSTRKRKANSGSFKPGYDPRRHTFTAEERSAGFWTAIAVLGCGIGRKLNRAGRWAGFRGKQGRRRPR